MRNLMVVPARLLSMVPAGAAQAAAAAVDGDAEAPSLADADAAADDPPAESLGALLAADGAATLAATLGAPGGDDAALPEHAETRSALVAARRVTRLRAARLEAAIVSSSSCGGRERLRNPGARCLNTRGIVSSDLLRMVSPTVR
jgi:hypothetical protein